MRTDPIQSDAPRLQTVAEIVKALGGSTAVGRICGFDRNQAARGSDFRQRGSIPVIYWERIVASPEGRKNGITYETLVKAHAPERVAS